MPGIALTLKEHTRSAHNSAEHHSFQRSLGSGEISLPLYRAYLSQLWLIHQALEQALIEKSASVKEIETVITDDQMQCPWLSKDLQALAVDEQAVSPEAATRQIVDKIRLTAAECPVALLGYHYVLLGSKHGGKYIASMIKEKHKLDGAGTLYFDPYGQEFQKHWKHFTSTMNELELDEHQSEKMIAAASDMFRGVEAVGHELEQAAERC